MNEYYTTSEASDILGYNYRTLTTQQNKRKFGAIKVGHILYLRKDLIDKFSESIIFNFDDYYTGYEASKLLGVTRQALTKRANKLEVKCHKTKYYYKKKIIDLEVLHKGNKIGTEINTMLYYTTKEVSNLLKIPQRTLLSHKENYEAVYYRSKYYFPKELIDKKTGDIEPSPDKYYKTNEVCKLLNLTPSTVGKQFKTNCVRWHRYWYYEKSAIDSAVTKYQSIDPKAYYTTKEVAYILNCSLAKVASNQDTFKGILFKGKWMFPKSVIDKLSETLPTKVLDIQSYYTSTEASNLLDITSTSIRRKATSLGAIKYKGILYYSKELINTLLNTRDTSKTTPLHLQNDWYSLNQVMQLIHVSKSDLTRQKQKFHVKELDGKLYCSKGFIDMIFEDDNTSSNTLPPSKQHYYSSLELRKLLKQEKLLHCIQNFKYITYTAVKDIVSYYYSKREVNTTLNQIKSDTSNQLDLYYTETESKRLLRIVEAMPLRHLQNAKTFNNKPYYPKQYIHQCIKTGDYTQPHLISFAQLEAVYGVSVMYSTDIDKYEITHQRNYSNSRTCSKKLIEHDLEFLRQRTYTINDYIEYNNAKALYNINLPQSLLSELSFEALYTDGKVFYKRTHIENYIDIINNYIPLTKLLDKMKKYGVGKSALKTLLIGNTIPTKLQGKNLWVKKDQIDKLESLCQTTTQKLTPFDIFKKTISITPYNDNDTIDIFKEYTFNRINVNSSNQVANALSELYIFLAFNLKGNLPLGTDAHEQCATLLNQLIPTVQSKRTISEAIYFFNHIVGKKAFSIERTTTEETPYPPTQFLELYFFVYHELDNPQYLTQLLSSRNLAMSWLYLALHFVTMWRRKDMASIPIPDLELIGFKTGHDFFEWLNNENDFTEEMGLTMCHNMQQSIYSLGQSTQKTTEYLVFEYGNIVARPLGLLLAICESHRRVAFKTKSNWIGSVGHTQLISERTTRDLFRGDTDIGGKIENILEGTFSNRKAIKSFTNYILTTSEKKERGIGAFIASTMRSHKLNDEFYSGTIQYYMKNSYRNVNTVTALTLFDRGTFGFTKHLLLSFMDDNYKSLDSEEQTKIVQDLPLTPNEIEQASKTLHQQTQIVSTLLTKAVSSPNKVHDIINEVLFGNTTTTHKHTRCLFKAITNMNNTTTELKDTLNSVANECIYDASTSCIGCPMLIKESLFLNELAFRLDGVLNRLSQAPTNIERDMYMSIIYNGYMPILMEATKELGKDVISQSINMTNLREKLKVFKQKKEGNYVRATTPPGH